MKECNIQKIRRWRQEKPELRLPKEEQKPKVKRRRPEELELMLPKEEEQRPKDKPEYTIKNYWLEIKEDESTSYREKALMLRDFDPKLSKAKIVELTGWKRFHWWIRSDEARKRLAENQKKSKSKSQQIIADFKSEIGGCCKCGYNSCNAALEFHHVDADQKHKTVGSITSKERLIKEIKKCVLLCSNCHREHHAGMIPQETIEGYHKNLLSDFYSKYN